MSKPAGKTSFSRSQAQAVENRVFETVEPVLEEKYYLLAVDFEKEFGQWFLRLYIAGRDFRISLDDCETVSRRIDPLIEALPELGDISYNLEVSSPGAFRPLKTRREMDFYRGQPVRVVKHLPHDPKARQPKVLEETTGVLQGFDDRTGTVALTLKEGEHDGPVSVRLEKDHAVYLNPDLKPPEPDQPDQKED